MRYDETIKDSKNLNVLRRASQRLFLSFFFGGRERGYCSLAYLEILALKSVRQIEGHRWEKLCESV